MFWKSDKFSEKNWRNDFEKITHIPFAYHSSIVSKMHTDSFSMGCRFCIFCCKTCNCDTIFVMGRKTERVDDQICPDDGPPRVV